MDITLRPQGDRMPQESAGCVGIVPAHLPSLSCEGPSTELTTSSVLETVIAAEKEGEEGVEDRTVEEFLGFIGEEEEGEGERIRTEMPLMVELVEQEEEMVDLTGEDPLGEIEGDPLEAINSRIGTRKRRKAVNSPTEESDEDYFQNLRVSGRKKKVKEEGKKVKEEGKMGKEKERDMEELMEAGREEEEGWKDKEKEKEKEEGKGKEVDVGTRRRTRAGRKMEEEEKKDTPEGKQGPTEDLVGPVEYRGVSVAALGAMALEWLTELDGIRVRAGMKKGGEEDKGKGLQGRISGIMKTKIVELKNISRTLTSRALVSGDVPFLKAKNEELRKQIKEKEEQMKEKDRKIKDLEKEMREIKEEKVEKERKEREKERTEMSEGKRKGNTYPEDRQLAGKRNEVDTYLEQAYLEEDIGPRNEEEVFLRPAIRGRTTVITAPVLNLKKKEEINKEKVLRELEINRQIQELVEVRKNIRRGVEIDKGREERERYGKVEEREIPKERRKPRIIEDIQLVPPKKQEGRNRGEVGKRNEEEEWKIVERRKQGGQQGNMISKEGGGKMERNIGRGYPSMVRKKGGGVEGNARRGDMRKGFRTAAVSIRSMREGGTSYAEILGRAKGEVSLTDLGIEKSRIRVAANGGRIIEIPEPDGAGKADNLARKLKEIIGKEAWISRPVARGELRLSGFDDSVSKDEIMYAVAEQGGCSTEDIRVGQVRRMDNGLGTAWIQCPLGAANKAARIGRVRVGWIYARLEILRSRPVQCYRCWAFGHLRNQCSAEVDRRDRCYRCGERGHKVSECGGKPRCLICEEEGRNGEHRIGSVRCTAERYPGRNRRWENRDRMGQSRREGETDGEESRRVEVREEEEGREMREIEMTDRRNEVRTKDGY